jgi:hypothetical protein
MTHARKSSISPSGKTSGETNSGAYFHIPIPRSRHGKEMDPVCSESQCEIISPKKLLHTPERRPDTCGPGKANVFDVWLKQFRSSQEVRVPPHVVNQLEAAMEKHAIRPHELTPKVVRKLLSEIKHVG